MSFLIMATLLTYVVENWKLLLAFLIVWKIVRFIYTNFFRKRLNLLTRYGPDSWALVTGATDGIGKALCEELVKEGFNIILVSRTLQKLKNVSADLIKINPRIKTHLVEYDFNIKNKLEDYLSAFGNLQEKYDVSILINNVGLDHHNTFERVKIDHLYSMLNLNVIPQTLLTKILLNGMNARKDRSSVITLSSFAGEFPFPMKS